MRHAGLFDAEKEVARLRKQQEKLAGELAGIDGRLSNEKFVQKAPQHVVADARKQREDSAQRLSLIEEKLLQMQTTARTAKQ